MNTKIEVKICDITTLKVDAIVNAANSSLLGGGGVDGAIHRAAGFDLLRECQSLNGCETGRARITKGYNLPANYIIHTVGPVWKDGNQDEEKLLKSCYYKSLKLAEENNIKSIAFPAISTGIYRFPIELACKIARESVEEYLMKSDSFKLIIFSCFTDEVCNSLKKEKGSIYEN